MRRQQKKTRLAELETIRSIVNRLGENGYSAVDSKNQIDMTEPEQVAELLRNGRCDRKKQK